MYSYRRNTSATLTCDVIKRLAYQTHSIRQSELFHGILYTTDNSVLKAVSYFSLIEQVQLFCFERLPSWNLLLRYDMFLPSFLIGQRVLARTASTCVIGWAEFDREWEGCPRLFEKKKKKSSPEASINQREERNTLSQRNRKGSHTKLEDLCAKYSSERGDTHFRNGRARVQDPSTCELDARLDYFLSLENFLNLYNHCACVRRPCAWCLRKVLLRFTLGWICRGRDEREEAIGRRAELQSARLLGGGSHRLEQKA